MKRDEIAEHIDKLRRNVASVVIGLEEITDLLLVALISGGHVLLEGPPGIGKTTLAKTFAMSLGCKYKRIQMTPDLLPADILGVNVFKQNTGTWELRKGPIFSDIILVDELNRASPKVQSAFLEAMQESQVSIEGETLPLSNPFMVIATQVPYAGVGTYLLTDVQIDRFAFKIDVGYPENDSEMIILSRIDEIDKAKVSSVLSEPTLKEISKQAANVYVHQRTKQYILEIIKHLRENPFIRTGPSTRAGIWFMKGARTLALLDGRDYTIPDDVKRIAKNVLAHRIELTPQAMAEQIEVASLISDVLVQVEVPKGLISPRWKDSGLVD